VSDTKYVFIVTGKNEKVNPDEPKKDPTFFTRIAAISAMNEVRVLSKNKRRSTSRITVPSDVQFIHFNFEENVVRFYKHSFSATGNDPFPDTIKKHPQSLFTDNDPVDFIKIGGLKLSIVDVYHSIRSAPLKSVLDVHIYSHGFLEGPVLVNSDDNVENDPDLNQFHPSGKPRRDPNDKDGRVRTDFATNMGEDPEVAGEGQAFQGGGTALDEFKSKFVASGGTVHVYGCDIQDKVVIGGRTELIRSTPFLVIHEVFDKPIQSATSPIGIALRADDHAKPTNVPIRIDKASDNEAKLKDPHDPTKPLTRLTVPQLIGGHLSTDNGTGGLFEGNTDGNVTSNYVAIVKYIARQTQKIYVYAGAKALSGITFFGGVPGTSGDKEKPEGGDHTMIVKGYGRYLNFYQRYLGIDTKDPDSIRPLRYGRFDTATVNKIDNHANNG
jgi:hypothetical protein